MTLQTKSNLLIPQPISSHKRTEWPWAADNSRTKPNGLNDSDTQREWPRVTVVTPSYNQADYLEETIRSVLMQGYPNLEYIVIDGGSTDGSVDIIKHYEAHLTYWVSEPDSGQTNAINKGWQRATGEYVTWLNSDDLLLPGSLFTTVSAMLEDPNLDIVYGNTQFIDSDSQVLPAPYDLMYGKPWSLPHMIVGWWNPAPQQGFLMKRDLLERIGYLDESYHFTMDFEYWVRIAVNGGSGKWLKETISQFRQHPDAKTSNLQLTLMSDKFRIYEKVFGGDGPPSGYGDKRLESQSNLHLHAVRNAYLDNNSSLLREHLGKYLKLRGAAKVLLVWQWIVLSGLTDGGLARFRNVYRNCRKLLAFSAS